MSKSRKAVRVLVPLLVVGLGAAVFVAMVKSRRGARTKSPELKAPLVEVRRIEPGRHPVVVRAQGTVAAARHAVISPEVSGRVVAVGDEVVPGGRVARGDVLFRVDGRDYALAVDQAAANVARAELELAMEQGRRDVAAREWKLLGAGRETAEASRALALREPQLKAAEAALASAKSAVARARLAVERTTVRAPFDALVVEERLEVGEVVGPQSQLVTLVGADRYWVHVSLPVDQLDLIGLPDGSSPGAAATVVQHAGATKTERRGQVVRLLGGVDPAGRMARLVVEVADPLDVAGDDDASTGLPLLLDAFVDVALAGREMQDAFAVPRAALRNGDNVYLAADDDTLVVRAVQVAWREQDTVLVTAGIEPGSRLVVGHVPAPAPGMKLRVQDRQPATTARTDAP